MFMQKFSIASKTGLLKLVHSTKEYVSLETDMFDDLLKQAAQFAEGHRQLAAAHSSQTTDSESQSAVTIKYEHDDCSEVHQQDVHTSCTPENAQRAQTSAASPANSLQQHHAQPTPVQPVQPPFNTQSCTSVAPQAQSPCTAAQLPPRATGARAMVQLAAPSCLASQLGDRKRPRAPPNDLQGASTDQGKHACTIAYTHLNLA